MSPEPGIFEAFYAGPIQHPGLLWLAGLLGLVVALRRPGLGAGLRAYCAALGVLTLLDAWLTSSRIPGLGTLSGAAASAVPLFFVLAGDLRFLLLLEIATPEGRLVAGASGVARAVGLTLVVPIASQLVMAVMPSDLDTPRMLFLVYELAFVALVMVLRRLHGSLRHGDWRESVSRFVLLYYGLWASADLIILLTGSDLGFLLRIVPNLLYYGGLIAVIGRLAPAGVEGTAS